MKFIENKKMFALHMTPFIHTLYISGKTLKFIDKKLENSWHGAGYYWLDSNNEINYSVVDARLENVPFSTVPKCEVCDALGEICPACGDDEAVPIEKV